MKYKEIILVEKNEIHLEYVPNGICYLYEFDEEKSCKGKVLGTASWNEEYPEQRSDFPVPNDFIGKFVIAEYDTEHITSSYPSNDIRDIRSEVKTTKHCWIEE